MPRRDALHCKRAEFGWPRRVRGSATGGRAAKVDARAPLRSLEALPASSSTSAVRYSARALARPVNNGRAARARPAAAGGSDGRRKFAAETASAAAHNCGLERAKPAGRAHPESRRSRLRPSRRRARWRSRGSTRRNWLASAGGRASQRHAGAGGAERRPAAPGAHLEEAVNTADGELEARARRARDRLLLLALLVTHRALGTLPGQPLGAFARHGCCALRRSGGDEDGSGGRGNAARASHEPRDNGAAAQRPRLCVAAAANAIARVREWERLPPQALASDR